MMDHLLKPRYCITALLISFGVPLVHAEANPTEKAGAIEVRRFSVSDGTRLPKEFPDFLYALLTEKLQRSKMGIVVLGENEVSDPPGHPLILEGKMLAVRGAWYRGAGEKVLRAEVTLRRSPNETIFKKEVSAAPSVWKRVSYPDENELWSAGALADRIVKEIQAAFR